MKGEDVGSLPVVDDGHLVAVLTDRDLVVRAVAEGVDPNAIVVGEVASRGLVTVDPEQDLDEALALMARHQVRRLPVVEEIAWSVSSRRPTLPTGCRRSRPATWKRSRSRPGSSRELRHDSHPERDRAAAAEAGSAAGASPGADPRSYSGTRAADATAGAGAADRAAGRAAAVNG